MQYPMTPAIRPVCKAVNDAIRDLPNGPFNFGLYFQKWFFVSPQTWKCATDMPKGRGSPELSILDNMEVSIKLFNREPVSIEKKRGQWDYTKILENIKNKHTTLEGCAEAFKKQGYKYIRYEIELSTPLIIGLGNEHPTEKGFRFDWTLGIPFIPASSIKGVVRLAYLVNELNKFDEEKAGLFLIDILKDKLPETGRNLFGTGGEKDALRGKAIFLDAYPDVLPRLKPEIMNCHYPDYLNKRIRGPTEDQQPNPQKYWAVDPYLDKQGTPLKFIFRFLLHKDIANNEAYRDSFDEALKAALEEHGLGAKTAIGHGRFSQKVCVGESQQSTSVGEGAKEEVLPSPLKPEKPVPQKETWDQANLTWSPGNMTITAAFGNKKATCKGKGLVPEIFHKKLFDKRTSVTARVEVEPVGGKNYRIIKIE